MNRSTSTDKVVPQVAADHFDGVSARPRPVRLRVEGGLLHIDGDDTALRVPLDDVAWPERTRHGTRVAHLRDGGSLQAHDAAAWDAWARQAIGRESWVVRAQQSWRSTLCAVLVLVALAGIGYVWGVPWLARGVLAVIPASVDRAIGGAALDAFDAHLLLPSSVPLARQQALREAFDVAVARTYSASERPAHTLRFQTSPKVGKAADARTQIGPNAFALPGGTIVVTDELVTLLQGRDDVMLGVLGHELGHVRRRHGMRMLVQAAVIGTATSVAWGDFSSLLATAPVLLGQRAYSRDFEREADLDAIALLRANHLSPLVMVELFERLAASRGPGEDESRFGIALASHPADAERIQAFRDAAP